MPNRTKIVDASEVRRWIEEGKTYRWMKEEYLRKYNIEIGETTFIELNRRNGWSYRYAVEERGNERPWKILEGHRGRGWDVHLSALIRRDGGFTVNPDKLKWAEAWWAEMEEAGMVVTYTPERGFIPVPRRPGIDKGMIREPHVE